jgi:hypothetical protein
MRRRHAKKPATSSTGSSATQTQRLRDGAVFMAAVPESDSSFTSSSATFTSSMCWRR